MFNQVKVTLINLYHPIIPSTQLSAIFFGQIFSSKSCWIHVDILFKQTIFKTYHLNVFFSRIEHTKTPKKRTERRHENFQLSSFSLADFQRKNSKIQVGDSIPERLQSCFSRSLVEVAGKLNYMEKVWNHRWVWWTWFFTIDFVASKRHGNFAWPFSRGWVTGFLSAEEGDTPSLKLTKRP